MLFLAGVITTLTAEVILYIFYYFMQDKIKQWFYGHSSDYKGE